MLEQQKFEQFEDKSLDQVGFQPGKDVSAVEQMDSSAGKMDIDDTKKGRMEDMIDQSYEGGDNQSQAYNFTAEQKADYRKQLEAMNSAGQPINEDFLKTMYESGVIESEEEYKKYSGGKEYQPEGAEMQMDEFRVRNDFGVFLHEQNIDFNTLSDEEKKNLIDQFRMAKGYGDVSNEDFYKMMSKVSGVKEENLYPKNAEMKTENVDSGGTNNGPIKVEGGTYNPQTSEIIPDNAPPPPTNPWTESMNEDATNYMGNN